MIETLTEETVAFAVDYEETSEEFTARIVATVQRQMDANRGISRVYVLED